ncbi:hypothetical protein GCM10027404_22560 [Arthrobacter tumbae]|uniref:M15 family metallopeptidase n=1 Tax=Arthrobacter tumbae TaxID=163874 RepID=UPI001956981B|nr:M15 family metallopeptidase [Arthrobacter tumbae]MBM7781828.1 hypothetical protein [Arthrobacter tumbae]
MSVTIVGRRLVLKGLSVLASVGAVALITPGAASATPVKKDGQIPSSRSANGWPIEPEANTKGTVWRREIIGSGTFVDIKLGPVEVVMMHALRRYHYEVAPIRSDEVIGFRHAVHADAGYETNHASGTAVDVRPDFYPKGTQGGYSKNQMETIRSILDDCEGVIEWGGDWNDPDEAHFQIAVQPGSAELHRVSEKIQGWKDAPSKGAGTPPWAQNQTRN